MKRRIAFSIDKDMPFAMTTLARKRLSRVVDSCGSSIVTSNAYSMNGVIQFMVSG